MSRPINTPLKGKKPPSSDHRDKGLAKTEKYSVDKDRKGEPSVSTPAQKKEDPAASSESNYGF